MGRRKLITTLTSCLLVFYSLVKAQDVITLPKLYPAYSEDFTSLPSYSPTCFETAYQDVNGKLWLRPCPVNRITSGAHLFQFDGYAFKTVKGDLGKVKGVIRFVHLHQGKELIGIAGLRKDLTLFHHDLLTDQLELYKLELEGTIETLTVSENGQILLVVRNQNTWFFYEWKDKQLLEEGSYNNIPPFFLERDELNQREIILLNEEEFWVAQGNLKSLLRINKKKGTVRKILLTEFPVEPPNNGRSGFYRALKSKYLSQKAAYVFMGNNNPKQIYKLNPKTDELEPISGFPENWRPRMIKSDQSGNLLFLFQDQSNNYQAILQDSTGQRFNFLPSLICLIVETLMTY